MAEKKFETLVHPDGREWTPTSAEERANLLARGWGEKDQPKQAKAATASSQK